MVESVAHILESLQGWQVPLASAEVVVPVADHPLLKLLCASPASSESLALSSRQSLSEVLVQLTELELDGLIAREGNLWLPCR